MKKKLGSFASGFVLCAILALTVAWTTDKSGGTAHQFSSVTASGSADANLLIGTSSGIRSGVTFISIINTAAGASVVLQIWTRDIHGTADTDTLPLNNGSYSGNYPHGVDSLRFVSGTGSFICEGTN